LLSSLFREVFVPPAVRSEFVRLAASDGRFAGVRFAAWIHVRQPAAIPERISRNITLDPGGAEALALAVEMHADAVLIDESIGRGVAIDLGLTPVGVLGVLVRPKRQGHLAALAPVVEGALTRAQFRVAPDLLREVLRMAGEEM
jgi:predicted nucleic acid-binding protein